MSERVVNLRDLREGRRYILPPDVIRIDRRTRWGNPYRIGCGNPEPTWDPTGEPMTREETLAGFRRYLTRQLAFNPAFLEPLRGKRLACWCAPLACHGDVIAELIP